MRRSAPSVSCTVPPLMTGAVAIASAEVLSRPLPETFSVVASSPTVWTLPATESVAPRRVWPSVSDPPSLTRRFVDCGVVVRVAWVMSRAESTVRLLVTTSAAPGEIVLTPAVANDRAISVPARSSVAPAATVTSSAIARLPVLLIWRLPALANDCAARVPDRSTAASAAKVTSWAIARLPVLLTWRLPAWANDCAARLPDRSTAASAATVTFSAIDRLPCC